MEIKTSELGAIDESHARLLRYVNGSHNSRGILVSGMGYASIPSQVLTAKSSQGLLSYEW